jgi:hypothetical protein
MAGSYKIWGSIFKDADNGGWSNYFIPGLATVQFWVNSSYVQEVSPASEGLGAGQWNLSWNMSGANDQDIVQIRYCSDGSDGSSSNYTNNGGTVGTGPGGENEIFIKNTYTWEKELTAGEVSAGAEYWDLDYIEQS